jgi:hypothetical protein
MDASKTITCQGGTVNCTSKPAANTYCSLTCTGSGGQLLEVKCTGTSPFAACTCYINGTDIKTQVSALPTVGQECIACHLARVNI